MRGTRVINDPKARDKPCLRCGYSLRKLEEARHCPECGLAVWLSLNGNESLELSNPVWLRRLSAACVLMAIAQVAALVTWIIFLGMRARAPADEWTPVNAVKGLFVAQEACVIASAIPLFLLAEHERRYPDKLKGFRRTLQVFGAIGVGIGVSMLWSTMGRPEPATVVALLPHAQWRLSSVSYIGAVPVFLYLRKLARRGPRPRVAKLCAAVVIVAVIWTLGWLRAGRMELQRLDAITPVFLCITCGTLLWFWRMLRNSAREAYRAWAAESARVE